jgi:hypothetical protein
MLVEAFVRWLVGLGTAVLLADEASGGNVSRNKPSSSPSRDWQLQLDVRDQWLAQTQWTSRSCAASSAPCSADAMQCLDLAEGVGAVVRIGGPKRRRSR